MDYSDSILAVLAGAIWLTVLWMMKKEQHSAANMNNYASTPGVEYYVSDMPNLDYQRAVAPGDIPRKYFPPRQFVPTAAPSLTHVVPLTPDDFTPQDVRAYPFPFSDNFHNPDMKPLFAPLRK